MSVGAKTPSKWARCAHLKPLFHAGSRAMVGASGHHAHLMRLVLPAPSRAERIVCAACTGCAVRASTINT